MLIEIPTRGRPEWLASTLAQLVQAVPGLQQPVEVMIIPGEPSEPTEQAEAAIKALVWSGVTIGVNPVPDSTPLPEKHQLAYDYAKENGHDLVMIMHDDLIMYPGFLYLLQKAMNDGTIGAIAGVYPCLALDMLGFLPEDYHDNPDFNGKIEAATNWHQVYLYTKEDQQHEPIRTDVEHLFGPVMYRVSALPQGFPVGVYSRTSHREETDFTHQILCNGHKLGVCKGALAFHAMYPKAGAAEDRAANMSEDDSRFQERLSARHRSDEPLSPS